MVVEIMTQRIKNDVTFTSQQSGHKERKDYIMRMLRALHPDKVKDTCLESVFTEVTKKILAMKDDIGACLFKQAAHA